MIWMISANGKIYDHASSFATNGFIDWRQRVKYIVGDIVYIYCTRPFMRVMYKCEVVKHSMPFSECIDDEAFWFDKNEYEKSKSGDYVRLKLLEQVDTALLNLEALKSNGLSAAPQGPIKVSPELNAYIERHFNDFYTEGLFNDVGEQKKYHEGHVKKVLVDKYERSSIARSKCIEYYGTSCIICGLNFGERYGKLGEGFIHIHHLRPLHTIGEDYVIDYKKDLVPVCPNCHAMIHRIPNCETMTIQRIKDVLESGELESTIQTESVTGTGIKHAKKVIVKDSNKKYIGKRVVHANPKFGSGLIKEETEMLVTITFDNGISTKFSKDSFEKGFLTITQE